MVLTLVSLIAVAIIVAGLGLAWSRRFLATGAIAIANVLVFALTAFGPTVRFEGEYIPVIHAELGLSTGNLMGDPGLAALQLLTSMFVHVSFLHLFGNLLILLAFALPFEERIGHRLFVVIYLTSGVAAALVQAAVAQHPILLLGASGAVFGVIGAFAASYPNLVVPLPLPLVFIMLFVRMRVWIAAVVFTALELLVVSVTVSGDNVAHFAHLGGVAAGVLLGWTLVKRNAPTQRRPVAVDLGALTPFARDAGTVAALTQMKSNHDEPQIFQAWLDRFFRTATCPTCGHKVMPRHHGEIVCTQGHRFDVRQDQRKRIAAA
jgi:membrane associated rhomboid family serine protease